MEIVNSAAQGVERAVKEILRGIDSDCEREGLRDTPKRVAKFYSEFLSPQPFEFTTFDAEGYDEMIVVSNVPFFSICEHHLAPFFGTASVAYIPDQKIVGLSKLPRTIDMFSRRLQNQERITNQIAEMLQTKLTPKGVAVVLKARHLCVEMRGVKKHDTWTTTSKMIGLFKDDSKCRAEFLGFISK